MPLAATNQPPPTQCKDRGPQIVPSHPVSPVYEMWDAGDIGRPLWLSAMLSQGLQGARRDRLGTLIRILISPEKRLGLSGSPRHCNGVALSCRSLHAFRQPDKSVGPEDAAQYQP